MSSSVQPGKGVLRNAYSVDRPAQPAERTTQHATHLPAIAPWLLRSFSAYSRWYVSRQFHSLRLSHSSPIPDVGELPLVIYANHAAWWDPLICLILQAGLFGNRRAYAPFDARALQQYRFFARLGFFGVEQNHRRGAVQFLRTAEAVLCQPDSVLWLTPQGRFADTRERPVKFKPGLGHLPQRVERAAFVPLAVEYTHWEERKPEVLCRFGPVEIAGVRCGFRAIEETDWSQHFQEQLQATQDALAEESQRRNPADFEFILRSGSGVGFFYDTWRALRAAATGQTYHREHGKL